jgi:tetratricopeptide (TPR) repeat protein
VIQERPTAAVISKRALTHKPPKEARKEFDRGVQSWRKGQSNQAQHHLEEAIRLDAGFVEAQTELGALYAEAGQPALALDYFNSALALDPNSAPPNTGKASVLVMLNRPAEAEQAARRALQFDPGSIAAHYMLGTALLMQDKITPEAVTHLSVAANKYPRARAFLAEAQADPAKRRNH